MENYRNIHLESNQPPVRQEWFLATRKLLLDIGPLVLGEEFGFLAGRWNETFPTALVF